MISISGVFAVTFSVVFAYVADVTTTEDRSKAYGLVSATFAASLVSLFVDAYQFMHNFIEFCSCISMYRLYHRHLAHICVKCTVTH